MAVSKDKKKEILAKLKEAAEKASTVVFVNFTALPVALVTEIRKTLRENGVGYFVAKKTLIKKAFGEQKIEGTMPELPGEIAITWGADQVAPAKGIYDYQKKNPDFLKIVGGIFEGKYVDGVMMASIASIPPREVLLGQLVNVINSPIQGLVIALDAIAKKQEAMA